MLIDWFTVAAQAVNFLILIALLRVFLYGRVVRAMEERDRRVAERFEQAEERESAAQRERDEYAAKRRELEESKKEILSEQKRKAEEERDDLIERARKEADDRRAAWERSVLAEREGFRRELASTVSGLVLSIGRKSLARLMDAELESRVVGAFLKKLEEAGKKDLPELPSGDGRPSLRVTTAFELPERERERIRGALRDRFGKEVETEFAESPELLAGVELAAGGRRLGLSLSGFLDELEGRVGEKLDEKFSRWRGGEDGDREAEGKEGGEAKADAGGGKDRGGNDGREGKG